LSRALPTDGRLITLEIDPKHAKIASDNIAHANLSDIVEVRIGKALDTLQIIRLACYTNSIILGITNDND
jgi:predicted O-methyltransferase YrrM